MSSTLGKEGVVLVVDDDPALAKVASALLRQRGIATHVVASGRAAIEAIESRHVDVVLTDLRMPDIDGMDLLQRVAKGWPDIPVVMMTAHGTVPIAVEAMKLGAADFLLKPFEREDLLFVIDKALSRAKSRADRPPDADAPPARAGGSDAMRECEERMARAAKGIATVLLRGESGTGKSLAARSIHEASPRKAAPFVTLQCAALPDALLEGELFGHEKGAFTGAVAQKPGRVELAEGGTLFLDEIGDISLPVQVKLLRLVQDREFERLGGVATLKADVRFIAATHRDLEAMVTDGTFREDLFYRLNVIPIRLPSLRERSAEIPGLARSFVEHHAKRNGREGMTLAPDATVALAAHAWPGNVRELQNLIERLVVMSDADTISRAHLERELAAHPIKKQVPMESPPTAASTGAGLADRRREAEREALVEALRKAGQNRTLAARLLGVSRRTLYNKLDELGLA